jgi:hypothetical protein
MCYHVIDLAGIDERPSCSKMISANRMSCRKCDGLVAALSNKILFQNLIESPCFETKKANNHPYLVSSKEKKKEKRILKKLKIIFSVSNFFL